MHEEKISALRRGENKTPTNYCLTSWWWRRNKRSGSVASQRRSPSPRTLASQPHPVSLYSAYMSMDNSSSPHSDCPLATTTSPRKVKAKTNLYRSILLHKKLHRTILGLEGHCMCW